MTNHFEAKLHGFRRTQDGVVVSYTVHPNDVSAELATAALGTRYMIGFAELGDDDQPKTELGRERGAVTAIPNPNGKREVTDSAPASRRKFTDLPLSQQAGMRCQENDFQFWLMSLRKWPPTFESANAVRYLCGVESRAHIIKNTPAGDKWEALEREFQSWVVTKQYEDVRR